MEMIRVELRGPLSGSEYDRLKSFLDENGTGKRVLYRTLVDFSRQAVGTKDVEVKLRVTNNEAEFIVKNGDFHDPSRQEAGVSLDRDQMHNMMQALSFLGYTTGIICRRNISKYSYNQLEFSIIEVPGHSHYYEAEIVCEHDKTAEAEITIREILESLDLEIFTKTEFFEYVESLNIEANELYDHRRDFPLKLKK
ncbi:hypothetical protein JW868_02245 [Candidatus Woesearchaeota archaeon]|nr:hypothetical protein [Candidatus Woesearchaeota archaeon]